MELRETINNFLKDNNFGYIGTSVFDMPKVMPAKYFCDDDLNIYIMLSDYEEVDILEKNSRISFCVSDEGNKAGGKAQVVVAGGSILISRDEEAIKAMNTYSDYAYMTESEKEGYKIVKLIGEEFVYMETTEYGIRHKQVLFQNKNMTKQYRVSDINMMAIH